MARVATNVRLDAAQLHQLKRMAVERGVSLSALFQELIADYLVRVSTLTGRDWRAVRFARLLLASRVVHVIRTDEAMEEAALNVYERLDDARLSFTDCVSFAVMRALEIPVAFAFDRDFERAGFRLVRGMAL